MPTPTVTIASAGGAVSQATQTVSGTVTAAQGQAAATGSTVTLFDNDVEIATAMVSAGGSWSANVTLAGDGAHTLIAADTSANGATGLSQAVCSQLGAVPPTVAITSAGGLTNNPAQTVTGTVTASEAAIGGTVTLYDNGTQAGRPRVGANGSWSTSVTLTGGANSLTASDTDAAGRHRHQRGGQLHARHSAPERHANRGHASHRQ